MSGRVARSRKTAALTCGLVCALLLGAALCGCATPQRQCTGALQPINGPAAVAAAPDRRDDQ